MAKQTPKVSPDQQEPHGGTQRAKADQGKEAERRNERERNLD